jgi:hypothetical protein
MDSTINSSATAPDILRAFSINLPKFRSALEDTYNQKKVIIVPSSHKNANFAIILVTDKFDGKYLGARSVA